MRDALTREWKLQRLDPAETRPHSFGNDYPIPWWPSRPAIEAMGEQYLFDGGNLDPYWRVWVDRKNNKPYAEHGY